MAPPPELIPDAVAEILLRIPPEEPAHLLRASLVCKAWRRILTDQVFLRRYREFHGTPPLLGFVGNYSFEHRYAPRFVANTTASPFPQPERGHRGTWALDCRHGRVLLAMCSMEENLLVWDPITGDRRGLRSPGSCIWGYSAAVLCAVAGCDHLDCHGGPFLVVAMWNEESHDVTWASAFSSETGAWSAATSVAHALRSSLMPKRGALVGNVMCFTLAVGWIVMYDLDDRRLSLIGWPDMPDAGCADAQPMTMEDGSLGLAAIDASRLCVWSRNVDANGAATWVQRRVIGIETMLPIGDPDSLVDVIGFAEGAGIIFVRRDVSTFTVELKSGMVRKISDNVKSYTVLPFMSFYTPDRANGRLPLPSEMN
ncbi:unnamed protein product [Urochloa decumbens]|uniref:F-box domain-containing protein n=1 Tax=Urochloa decumbens TaxID=240449 RepID=A0ABC8WBS7_9POAL